ncbi:MAG: hypothetical protein JSS02_09330 [Planctomycetes bacterium]|nr:hypothetical protein [Planctomycetota bacterium]
MVICPHCQIGFHPRFQVCPRCGNYQVPAEEYAQFLKSQIVVEIESGCSVRDVEQMLVDGGFSECEATELVAQHARRGKRRTRTRGFGRLVVGGLALLLSVPAYFILKIVAIGLFLFGCFALPSGLYSLITGRDSGIAPPDFVQGLLDAKRWIK